MSTGKQRLPRPASKPARGEPSARPGAGPTLRAASTAPLGNAHFCVDLGDGVDPRSAAAGFCEVVFPDALLADADVQTPQAAATLRSPHLVLRRAATGALDLYRWWAQARGGKAPRRTVVIELLAEDLSTPVMRWRFSGARPVGLTYSPLNAQAPGLLFETLTLAFEQVEMG